MNTLIRKTTAFSEKESANKTGIAKAFSEKERKKQSQAFVRKIQITTVQYRLANVQ